MIVPGTYEVATRFHIKYIAQDGSLMRIKIPVGFCFRVPILLTFLLWLDVIKRPHAYTDAIGFQQYVYHVKGRLANNLQVQRDKGDLKQWMPFCLTWKRKDADLSLRKYLIESGVNYYAATLLYWHARIFGWFTW